MNTCANCNAPVAGKFCSNCGEKILSQKDFSLPSFLEQSVDMFTHFDGKIFGSIRSLIFQPGQLTIDNWNGKRVPYAKPFQLFIVLNALFYLLNHYTVQFNIFNTILYNHLNSFSYSDWASQMFDVKLKSLNLTFDVVERKFNTQSDSLSKTLILTMIPMFATITFFLFWKRNLGYVKHLILATHFYSFLLLGCCALIALSFLMIVAKNVGVPVDLSTILSDRYFSLFIVICIVYFLARSITTVFQTKWYTTFFLTILLVFGIYYALVVYRFLLFLLVLQTL